MLSYSGDNYVLDTATANVGVVVEQRDPATDSEYIDYSKSTVWVRFDVWNPLSYPSGTPMKTVFAQVQNAGDWSTTGHGAAQTSLGMMLTDGSYMVVANLVLGNGSIVGALDPYISGDQAIAILTSSPVTGSFVTGGGYINPDSTANTSNTHGNFGFTVKFNKSGTNLQGNAVYVYRMWMDVTTGVTCTGVGGPNCRYVDIVVKSNSLTALSVTPTSSTTGTAAVTGKFSVQYNDALTGQQYTQFGFGNGTFQINVTDGGSGGSKDMSADAMRRSDGTIFHLSSGTTVDNTGSATQVILGGGNITVHQ